MSTLARAVLFAFFRAASTIGFGAWIQSRSKSGAQLGSLLENSLIHAAFGFFVYWAVFSFVRHPNRAVPYSVLVLLAVPGAWFLFVFIPYPEVALKMFWRSWQWNALTGLSAVVLMEVVELTSKRLPSDAR